MLYRSWPIPLLHEGDICNLWAGLLLAKAHVGDDARGAVGETVGDDSASILNLFAATSPAKGDGVGGTPDVTLAEGDVARGGEGARVTGVRLIRGPYGLWNVVRGALFFTNSYLGR
jgi:hypothetical protein